MLQKIRGNLRNMLMMKSTAMIPILPLLCFLGFMCIISHKMNRNMF